MRLASFVRLNLIGALLLALLAATAARAAPVAEVVALRGFASLIVAGVTKPLKTGGQIEAGWEIRTSSPGRVKLRFVDGSIMVIGDSTRLKIAGFQPDSPGRPRTADFLLDVGLISQVVAPSEQGQWSVRTPSAVTAVRGTEYLVEVSPERLTDVHVQSGSVSVVPVRTTRHRSLDVREPAPVLLDSRNLGTSCDAAGTCSPAKVWKEERVRALADRLSGL